MGLLNQQKKNDKKSNSKQQKGASQSKFIGKGSKPAGAGKKMMTGGSQRGS